MLLIKDNSKRSREVIIFFWIYIAMSVLSIIGGFYQYNLVSNILSNTSAITTEAAATNDLIQRIASLASIGSFIILAVFFIRWFRRAYYNLHALPGVYASLDEGWAAGAWFVPLLNLVRPYQIMKEIWEGTQQFLSHRITPRSSALVNSWWAIYLGTNIFSGIASRMVSGSANLEDLKTNTIVYILSEVMSIVAAIVAMLLVNRMSEIENELMKEAQTPSDSIFAVDSES